MENHRLGTNNDKICAEISTGNIPNTPQLIRRIYQFLDRDFFATSYAKAVLVRS